MHSYAQIQLTGKMQSPTTAQGESEYVRGDYVWAQLILSYDGAADLEVGICERQSEAA